jgi:Tol biopolymer transport system component
LETPEFASGPEIVRYDSASGKRTVVADEKLLVPGTKQRLSIHGLVCSPTVKRFVLHTDEAGGTDRWLYELEFGDLRPVKAGDGVGFEANAFSPDGRRLLGSRGADMLVFDISSGRATPLTQDSDPDVIDNGRASWSPDG